MDVITAWATSLQLIEGRVERPANPEILFDVLCLRAKPGSGPNKRVKAFLLARSQHSLKVFDHRLLCCLPAFMKWLILWRARTGFRGTTRLGVLGFPAASCSSEFA